MDIKQKYEAAQAKADALKKRMIVAARADSIKKRKAETQIKIVVGGSLLKFLKENTTLNESEVRTLLHYCEHNICFKEPHRSLWEAQKAELLARFTSSHGA